MNLPYLVVSNKKGNIFEIPEYLMAGMSLKRPLLPKKQELIPLPYGSNLFMLPRRTACGYDPVKKCFTKIKNYQGNRVYPVAAFMSPAYLSLYNAAFYAKSDIPWLSLYSYTALGWRDGQFHTTGIRIDEDVRQDLELMDPQLIEKKANIMLKKYPGNRLVEHLINKCVKCYACPAARNLVMERWECPVPTSPHCNANCFGCISQQAASSGVKASQQRIAFIPSIKEIVEFTIPHLETAPQAIISFGQGCEGEPLLVGDIIEQAIRQIRKKTKKGIININTNGSKPQTVKRLCQAGLDSIRVSLNSVQEYYYDKYYRPGDYSFNDVVESLRIVGEYGKWSSINYLVFPGFTDHPMEIDALRDFIKKTKINMIQTRNLNIDPDWYIRQLDLDDICAESIGISGWLKMIQKYFPWIKLGYFNPPREKMNNIL